MKLNLGCGRDIREGYVNLDCVELPGVNVVADLEKKLQFEDDTFDEMHMSHTIEHIRNLLPMMQELHRIAKPDCILHVFCPHGATNVADEDPTHYRRMFPESFVYFGQPAYWRADYGYRGDWDAELIQLDVSKREYGMYADDPQKIADDVRAFRNIVLNMYARLRAIKPIRPMPSNPERKQATIKVVFGLVEGM